MMKGWMKKIRKQSFALVMLLLIVLVMPLSVLAAGKTLGEVVETATVAGSSYGYVFDKAGLLTDTEKANLESRIEQISAEKQVAIVILTVDDAEGKSQVAVADDFYDQNGFGYGGSQGPGILYLIDMDNRQLHISTAGTAITYFTDARIDKILDDAQPEVVDGDYGASCDAFLDGVEKYMNLDPNAKEPMGVFGVLVRLLIAIAAGGVVTFLMVHQSGGKVTVNANNYFVSSSANLLDKKDVFRNRTVSRRVIPKDNDNDGGGSSTHTSSGGVSHGGGSRGF